MKPETAARIMATLGLLSVAAMITFITLLGFHVDRALGLAAGFLCSLWVWNTTYRVLAEKLELDKKEDEV